MFTREIAAAYSAFVSSLLILIVIVISPMSSPLPLPCIP